MPANGWSESAPAEPVSRTALAIAGAVALVLIVFASGYGYHRDELYFLAAGQHLAWGYADQGPLTPLLARAMSELAPNSLTMLRVPSALAAAGTVQLTSLLARELGGSQRSQVVAAACAAVASVVLFTGHLLSTSTFDLLCWTAVSLLAVRAIRRGEDRLWLLVGVVLGVGLLNKPLPAFLAAGLVAGVVIAGPRRLLRRRELWAGAAIAVVLWSPWIIWQARHGWPQFDVSRSIAAGDSTSSQPWWAIVPFQVLLLSPPLAPVWIAGLIGLLRDPALRPARFLAWAWLVLAVVFMASGGKPYYLAGLLPALIASGAITVDRWLDRGRPPVRKALLICAVILSGVVGAVIALPVLPAGSADQVVAVNPDVGETIGWPEFARTIARVYQGIPQPNHAVILTENYGEAGALDRYGPRLGLPPVYSGHNAYGEWGPPPDASTPVIVVGYDRRTAETHFRGCNPAARISNEADIENDELGAPVLICRRPRRRWSEQWHALRHLG